MFKKVFISSMLLSILFSSAVLAHGGEYESKNVDYSWMLYVSIFLYLLTLIGFSYYYGIERFIRTGIERQSISEDIRKMFSKKAIYTLIISSFFLLLALITTGSFALLETKAKQNDFKSYNHQLELNTVEYKFEGSKHLNKNQQIEYSHYPPTSGNHYDSDIAFGFYDYNIPYELLIHNMEYGDIIIYYHPSINKNSIEHLKSMSEMTHKGSGIIVVPNVDIQEEIIMTAWMKQLKQEKFNEQETQQFIYNYIYNGPEKYPNRSY